MSGLRHYGIADFIIVEFTDNLLLSIIVGETPEAIENQYEC